MYDIFFAIYDNDSLKNHIKSRFPLAKFCVVRDSSSVQDALFDAQRRSTTKMFWFVNTDQEIVDGFDFDYKVSDWDQRYAHVFVDSNVFLIPKDYRITEKEASYRFFVNKKDVDLKVSNPRPVDVFFVIYDVEEIKHALATRFPNAKFCYLKENTSIGDLLHVAQRNALTEMFWFVHVDYYVTDDFNFKLDVPRWDQHYVHVFKDSLGNYGGVFLIPKFYPITKKEADHLFFVNKKEIHVHVV
jgi:hypothetical protein